MADKVQAKKKITKKAPSKEIKQGSAKTNAKPTGAHSPKLESKKKKKNTNLMKLCVEMNRMVLDAVDREVIKRFKTIIDTSIDDITKTSVVSLIKDPDHVEISIFDEGIQAYIKHYIFMRKRIHRDM